MYIIIVHILFQKVSSTGFKLGLTDIKIFTTLLLLKILEPS